MTQLPLFTPMKAKKAKHGFKLHMGDIYDIVAGAEAVKFIEARSCKSTWIEFNTSYSSCELKVYTDDDNLALLFAEQFANEL